MFLQGPTLQHRELYLIPLIPWGSPCGLDGKESTCHARDTASIPGLGKPPGGGNGNPLQYSCLGNPMDRGACWSYSSWGGKRVRRDLATKQ